MDCIVDDEPCSQSRLPGRQKRKDASNIVTICCAWVISYDGLGLTFSDEDALEIMNTSWMMMM